jgi:MFS family permease
MMLPFSTLCRRTNSGCIGSIVRYVFMKFRRNIDWWTPQAGELLGLVNTTYSIGAIVAGWFIGGPTVGWNFQMLEIVVQLLIPLVQADFLGRRWGMGLGCFITVVATFIQTFAPYHKIGVFIFGRVLIGIGQGMALSKFPWSLVNALSNWSLLAAGPVYIGEITPPEIRGTVMSFWQLFYSVGAFIAYWVNYACGEHSAKLGNWDWKMVVIFQMLVPIIILTQLPFLPETPRWYIQHGNRIDDARATLRRVRENEQDIEDELLTIREAIEYEKEVVSSSYWALFKDPSVRKRLYIAFVINAGQQLSGQGTLNQYSSTIYAKVFVSTNTINLINALNATFGILFTLNATWTVDRFGRKPVFIVGSIGMALCMLIVPLIGLETPTVGDGGKSRPVGIAITAMLFLFIFFYKPSWGATTWIWTSEVFSMNVRSQAVGMCSQTQNVAQAIFNQFFPTFYANKGL